MNAAMPPTARRAAWLGAFVLAITAYFSAGVNHADEHYQVLEFAGWKLGITPESDLPWEFPVRMRPALQPAMVVVVHHVLSLFGDPDPFTVATLLRLLTAMLSFVATLLLLRGRLRIDPAMQHGAWLRPYLFLAFFLWFGVYGGVRFSSEGLSAALFAIGFAAVAYPARPQANWPWLLAGVFLGLAAVARSQTGLMVAGLLAWSVLVAGLRWYKAGLLLLGCALSLFAGILIDRWFYGEWVLTAWNYIDLNILQDKASAFGTEPWWYYFAALFERMVPPFSLFFLLPPLVLFVFRRRDPLTWAVVPFVLAHLFIDHKEYRFFLPLVPLLPALVVGGLSIAEERGWLRWMTTRAQRVLRTLFLVVHVPLLIVILFKPAQDDIGFFRALHRIAKPGDTLLHDADDPFRQGLPVWFNRPKGLQVASIHDNDLHHDARLLYVSRSREEVFPAGMQAKLLFSSFPEWLLRFNVGGWADRTAVWRIWEVSSIKPATAKGVEADTDQPVSPSQP